MKRVVVLGITVVALAILMYYAVSQPAQVSPPEQDAGTSTTNPPPSENAIERPSNATLSHVAYVHDGDTLYLQPDGTTSRKDEITVRLIGIDTPELRPDIQCYAIEARDYLRDLLPEGSAVWITSDRDPLDPYDRSLLYLWTKSGTFVNFDLVKKGYATALKIAPNDAYWPQLKAAETEAQNSRRGQWGYC